MDGLHIQTTTTPTKACASGGNATKVRLSRETKSDGTQWVTTDTETSSCIDAGDPNDDYSGETGDSGTAINMGAYGNTAEASRSQP